MPIQKFLALLFVVASVRAISAQRKADPSGKRTMPWVPPAIDPFQDVGRPTVARELIQRLSVAGTPIVLEETKLKEMQKRFGGIIGNKGDASEALGWLCMQGGDTESRWILWLTSSEVSGPTIDGFQLLRLPPEERADRRCHLLRASGRVIYIPRGIHLGMTEVEVKKHPRGAYFIPSWRPVFLA